MSKQNYQIGADFADEATDAININLQEMLENDLAVISETNVTENCLEESTSEKTDLNKIMGDLENNSVANAIESICSEEYFDPRGECSWIQPMLKLSYSICPSTPTVEMQKAAIKRLTETMENDMEAEYGRNLKNSFELKHTILGKDTVTFIGEIQKDHEPLLEIQFLLRVGWEHASQEAGVQSKSDCRGMEIILN